MALFILLFLVAGAALCVFSFVMEGVSRAVFGAVASVYKRLPLVIQAFLGTVFMIGMLVIFIKALGWWVILVIIAIGIAATIWIIRDDPNLIPVARRNAYPILNTLFPLKPMESGDDDDASDHDGA